MRVAVTGASGLIGSALVPALTGAGHEVLTLVRRPAGAPNEVQWGPSEGMIDTKGLEGVGAIVHLAAESIEQRWTGEARRRILESRVTGTRLIAEAAASLEPRPVLVAASGVDAYGDRADEVLADGSPRGEGFLADVVEAWEDAAAPAREAGCRVVHLRQGFVLSRHGGALARMLLPFRLGLGGRVGSGRQWWSWVALDDVVAAYLHALERPLEGVVNLAAPGVVTSAEFARTLGSVLHRPAVFPLPAFAVRLMFGEMGVSLLLASHRVEPERLLADGFSFASPELRGALERALGKEALASPGA
jgi:uncharacterized protein (TIGR01777 family)